MHDFWSQYGFDAEDVKALVEGFNGSTVDQMILMSENLLKTKIANIRLSDFVRSWALKTVLSARSKPFTRAVRPIENRSNLSPEQYDHPFYRNHMLYQALGIYRKATTQQIESALQKQKALLLQHTKDNQQKTRLYERANQVFTNTVIKRAYETFGDNHPSANTQSSRPSQRTPVQRNQTPPHTPPRTPAGHDPVYAPPSGPPPAHLVAKYARERELRQHSEREERRLRNLHQGIQRAY